MNPLRRILRRIVKGQEAFLNPAFYTPPADKPVAFRARETALAMRVGRPPALILHGVTPRSGTVFVSELLALHPDLHAYPRGTIEFPFLRLTGEMKSLHRKYSAGYPVDPAQVTADDFLALFGSALITHFYTAAPTGKQLLLKMPGVEHLPDFYTAFPAENLILLIRDGRDVVSSACKSWPAFSFADVCRWWNLSARLILACDARFSGQANYFFTHYEEAVLDPENLVRRVMHQFGLNEDRYPFDRIQDLPVYGSSVGKPGKDFQWRIESKQANFKSVGRWTSWSEHQKRIFKRIAGQTLIDAGYSQDFDW